MCSERISGMFPERSYIEKLPCPFWCQDVVHSSRILFLSLPSPSLSSPCHSISLNFSFLLPSARQDNPRPTHSIIKTYYNKHSLAKKRKAANQETSLSLCLSLPHGDQVSRAMSREIENGNRMERERRQEAAKSDPFLFLPFFISLGSILFYFRECKRRNRPARCRSFSFLSALPSFFPSLPI